MSEPITYTSVPLTTPQLHLLLEAIGGPYVEDPDRFAVAWLLLKALGGELPTYTVGVN